MSATGEPSEEELRAAYEAEIKKIGVDQILLEQVVTLINLGMRRTGMAPGTEDERDAAQVRTAIEAVRALLPLVEAAAGVGAEQLQAIREALSQMQMTYVRMGGGDAPSGGAPAAGGPEPASPADAPTGGAGESGPAHPGAPAPPAAPGGAGSPEEAGPAQRSGRLWVPGQR